MREVTLQLPRRKGEYEDVLLDIVRRSSGSFRGIRLDSDDLKIISELRDAFLGVTS